jgi:threonine dehydratase
MTASADVEADLGRLPAFADVEAAAARLTGHVRRTPLLTSLVLDAQIGGRVLIKPECLQPTGSFKVRGAFNSMLQMSAEDRARGVVAWSAGNHGQALAFAGSRLGAKVTIVMPADAPASKLEGTRRWGAEVVAYDRRSESREEIGQAIAARTGAVIVPPYDDAEVIAGQGTAALEALQDARALGLEPDRLLCCVGGGGLIAGCALAAEGLGSAARVHSVEPAGYDDTARSLAAGRRVANSGEAASICDALMTQTPGRITFALNRRRLAEGQTVSDEEVRAAMRFALAELKLVVEPGGAAALAAVLFRPVLTEGATVLVLLTGGNVDLPVLARLTAA